jgi:hypothetical protein
MEPRKHLGRRKRILTALLLALVLSGAAITTRAAGIAQMMLRPWSQQLATYREYSTPDPQVRCRANGYRVYRSTNKWKNERLVFRVAKGEELSMASVPSADVCWVIGNRGLGVVIVNGKPPRRTLLPTKLDLYSIWTRDTLTATVAAIGGQVYETVDGGKTWKLGPKVDAPPNPMAAPACVTC